MDLTVDMLLTKRDYDNHVFSRKIIALFADKLTKAVQMLYKADRTINWYAIDKFNAVENYIVVIGDAHHLPGDIVNTAAGPLLVDASNAMNYTNTVRYVANSTILQHGTVEAIYQHLAFIEAIAKEVPDDKIIEILRSGAVSNNVVLQNPALSGIIEKITRPTSFESFDTSDMSEEQFNTLRLCANIGKTEHQH